MGLFSFLQRKKTPAPETRRRTAPPQDPVTVEALRTRARRRLIGAAVLVGGAVLGLPALFDKPPRPANQTFQVRMASGDTAAAGVASQAPTAAGPAAGASSSALPPGSTVALATAGTAAAAAMVLPGTLRKPPADEAIITEPKADARAEAAAEKLRAEKARAEKARAEKLKAEKAEKVREDKLKEEKARKEKAAKDVREAKAVKAAKEAKEAKEADKPRRYVIQAGSFSEAAAARDLGRRIDKLGLDSHEQRVETAAGSPRTRVRLGPFQSKEEALRAAARLKAAGLNAAVLPL
jgi:DedD protein